MNGQKKGLVAEFEENALIVSKASLSWMLSNCFQFVSKNRSEPTAASVAEFRGRALVGKSLNN